MLKRIRLKNSTILLIGIIIIISGVCIGLYEYFEERKIKTFSNMNIMLYENELPEYIESPDIENEEVNDQEQNDNIEQPEDNPENKESIVNQNNNYLGILEIPKINLKKGFYDINSKYNNVDYNITIINGSTYPNEENNNLILAAHSGNCSVCYFNKLYKLELDDYAYLYYKNIKYSYKIVDIYDVEKDGTVEIYRDYSKNVLTLITCTRNSNTKQTVYILEKI